MRPLDLASAPGRTARHLGWTDLVLGVGFGALVGLTVASAPAAASVVLALVLAGVAVLVADARVESWAKGLMLLAALTQPLNGKLFIPFPLSDATLLLALGAFVVVRLRDREPAGPPLAHRPLLIGLAILAVGGVIGAVFEAPGELWYQGTAFPLTDVTGWKWNRDALSAFVFGSGFPVLLWALARPSRELTKRVAGWFVAGCTISVLFGYLYPPARTGGRMTGLAVHSLQFGTICLVGVGAATALIMGQRRMPAWGPPVLVVLVMGIAGSGSRSALGGLLVLGLIIGPMTRNRVVIGGVIAGAAVIIILLATGIVGGEGDDAIARTLNPDASAQYSSDTREQLFDRVWDRWMKRPLTGNGFNHMRPSHNIYLGLVASAGVLGLIGFGTIVATIVRKAWRRRNDLTAVAATAGFIAYLAAAYYDYLLWWRWLWFYVALVVSLLATSPSRDEPQPSEGEPDRVGEPVPTAG